MSKLGEDELGTFQLGARTLLVVSAGASAVGASSPAPGAAVSGTATITASESVVSASSPTPGIDGSGNVTVSATESAASLTTVVPTFDRAIGATASTLSASTPSVSVSADSVTINTPVTSPALTSPIPSVDATGNVDVTSPTSTITILSEIPSVDATGNVDVSASTSQAAAKSPVPRIGVEQWSYTDISLGELISETVGWQEITLELRAGVSTKKNVLDTLNDDSGKVDVVIDSGGGFTAVDRSGGNTFKLKPPVARRNVRDTTDYHITSYTESPTDQVGDEYSVTLSFVRSENRTPEKSYGSVTRDTGEWKFNFDAGEFATTRVRRDIQGGNEEDIDTKDLILILTPRQTNIVEESARNLEAVNIREVKDGKNLAEDNSSSTVNTVTITAPSDATDFFSDGDYIVESWETEWISDIRYQVRLSLNKK